MLTNTKKVAVVLLLVTIISQATTKAQRYTIDLNTLDTSEAFNTFEEEELLCSPKEGSLYTGAFKDKESATMNLNEIVHQFPNATVKSFVPTLFPIIWSRRNLDKENNPYHPEFSSFYPDVILFESGQHGLSRDANEKLGVLVEALFNFPHLKVIVRGHADQDGDPDKNARISKQRAISARNFLIKSGIHQDRIKTIFMADAVPCEVKGIDNEDGKYDRRVDFILTTSPNFTIFSPNLDQRYDIPQKQLHTIKP